MSENLIYADLNLTESTRPRLQKVTDVQGSTYAEVKVQSLDTKVPASYTSSGKSCSSRTRVAVFVAVIILLLVLAVCLILMYRPTASSPADSKAFSNNSEDARETGTHPQWSSENDKQKRTGCPRNWEKHGEKCYYFFQTQETKDWNASRKECTDMNSDLVVIDTKDELVGVGDCMNPPLEEPAFPHIIQHRAWLVEAISFIFNDISKIARTQANKDEDSDFLFFLSFLFQIENLKAAISAVL
ncbi:NKG2-A/NKG2-B type II integral membrane protein-like isoform X2 [Rissa tridactyla]|uniref:NKG2-A/NKG2-B type II integral membrane protein-like isoform X2 n=1 Tax=Rissa tridactyla TaxID=75485 RepID=UPI0023BA587B|nr:NKG2-A/NKG2-B type II integral membrane protein-like isoform X2 [Rissa tridactyla]